MHCVSGWERSGRDRETQTERDRDRDTERGEDAPSVHPAELGARWERERRNGAARTVSEKPC